MSAESWLPLTEYSGKYKVSISTLRRRIKSSDVEYSFVEGKYLLKDAPLSDHTPNNGASNQRPTLRASAQVTKAAPPHTSSTSGHLDRPTVSTNQNVPKEEASVSRRPLQEVLQPANNDAQVLATANHLLNEIKKAFSIVLQEKEEQMIQLKDEVADLKTLVRVLEEDNMRLKSTLKESASIDHWLKSIDK